MEAAQKSGAEQPEQQLFDPENIYGEEGAIGMDAVMVTKMSFRVTCYSHTTPHVQLDETGAQQAMTEVVAPDGPNAGTYEDTVTFTSEGPHHIICFNNTCRTREKVFAGDIPIWDPGKVESNTYAGRKKDQAAQYQQMLGVKGKLP